MSRCGVVRPTHQSCFLLDLVSLSFIDLLPFPRPCMDRGNSRPTSHRPFASTYGYPHYSRLVELRM